MGVSMSLVSVSEAARLAGVSRPHLYRSYIKKGKISVQRGEKGEPLIDTSEIMRVFGSLAGDHLNDTATQQRATVEHDTQIQVLLSENNLLRSLVHERDKLIEEKDRHLDDVRQAMRLLEDKTEKKSRWKWW
jgi:hypothetical protein